MLPRLPQGAAIQLIIIRTALLLGLLLFGVSTWYTMRNGSTPMLSPETARTFGYVFIGLAATALAGMLFLRSRIEGLTNPKAIVTHYMIGYALAEGAGLFGGVVWFMGGSRDWYIAGLVLMVVAFQVLPVRREDAKTR